LGSDGSLDKEIVTVVRMETHKTSPAKKGIVLAVCRKADPGIPKIEVESIQLLEGIGVEGDYHAGQYVRHRYLAKKDPTQPNHRQVLLVDTVILEDLKKRDIQLGPGQMGENMLLDGIDLMSLEVGTRLAVGETLLEVSEIREPCSQLNGSHPNLFQAVKGEQGGEMIYNAGIFARIINGGTVEPGHPVRVAC
jgi:MOSC domain-containing protein YiiM